MRSRKKQCFWRVLKQRTLHIKITKHSESRMQTLSMVWKTYWLSAQIVSFNGKYLIHSKICSRKCYINRFTTTLDILNPNSRCLINKFFTSQSISKVPLNNSRLAKLKKLQCKKKKQNKNKKQTKKNPKKPPQNKKNQTTILL